MYGQAKAGSCEEPAGRGSYFRSSRDGLPGWLA